jgi:hypothetical protein
MPPASNGNPPYKGRSEELTTNIADFCNKIRAERTLESRPRGYVCEMVPYLDQLIRF